MSLASVDPVGMRRLAILFLFISSSAGQARETWIQVIGINQFDKSQNYAHFYQSALAFNQACAAQKKNRSCQTYMNTDPTRAMDAEGEYLAGRVARDYKVESTDKKTILAAIEKAFQGAKKNEKIVLALENHGAPTVGQQKGKSCIYLDAGECISEEDIAELLRKNPLPQGAKLAVLADACYSGAFHELMSEQVCVASTADQYYVGLSQRPWLWESVRDGKISKFSELSQITVGGRPHYLTADQIQLERSCLSFRQALSNRTKRDLPDLVQNVQSLLRSCDSASGVDTESLFSLASAIHDFTDAPVDEACRSDQFSEICKGFQDVKESLGSKAQALRAIAARHSMDSLFFQHERLEERIDQDLSRGEREYFDALVSTTKPVGKSKNKFESIPAERKRAVEKLNRERAGIIGKISQMKKALANELRSSRAVDLEVLNFKVQSLSTCLIENKPKFQADAAILSQYAKLDYLARQKPKKEFSESEIKKAKGCEDTFSF